MPWRDFIPRLRRAPASEARAESPVWLETIRRLRTSPSDYDAGVDVDTATALTHSAVYSCVDLLADLVSAFPTHRFRDTTVTVDGMEWDSKVRVRGPATVIEEPSDLCDSINWRRIIVVSWLLRGYCAGVVTETDGRDAYPRRIDLVHPDRVRATRKYRGDTPKWYLDGGEIKRYPLGELWIAPGKMMSPDDIVGASVLEFAKQEAGMGIAARRLGAHFFRDGGHPTAVLMNDKKIEGFDEAGAGRVRERFMRAMTGTREPAVMTDGWKYEAIQIKPDESQFLESINASRAMIASFFRVPPWAIGASAPAGSNVEYTNVEHRGLDLLKFTVQQWVARMEETLTPLTPRPQYVKQNVDALLRADTRTRYQAHDQGIRAGFMMPNEARQLEDLPPVEGGSKLLWPPYRSQLTDLELKLGEADHQEPDETLVEAEQDKIEAQAKAAADAAPEPEPEGEEPEEEEEGT